MCSTRWMRQRQRQQKSILIESHLLTILSTVNVNVLVSQSVCWYSHLLSPIAGHSQACISWPLRELIGNVHARAVMETEVCMVRPESQGHERMNTLVHKWVVASYQASESYCQSFLDVPPSPWPTQLVPVLYFPRSRKIRVSGNCPSGSAPARRPLLPGLCPYVLLTPSSLRRTGKGPGTILLATTHVVAVSPQ